MANKKLLSLIFILMTISIVLLSHIPLIQAQDTIPGLPTDPDDIEETMDSIPTDLDEAKDLAKNKSESYLSKEWGKILLENKVIAGIDSIFKKINIVFKILFGIDYSLSWMFLFVIILWTIVAIKLSEIFKSTIPILSGGKSIIAGFLGAIAIAQIRLYTIFLNFTYKMVISREGSLARAIMIISIVIIIIIFFVLSSYLSKWLEEKKKKAKEHATEITQKSLKKFSEKMQKTVSKGESLTL